MSTIEISFDKFEWEKIIRDSYTKAHRMKVGEVNKHCADIFGANSISQEHISVISVEKNQNIKQFRSNRGLFKTE